VAIMAITTTGINTNGYNEIAEKASKEGLASVSFNEPLSNHCTMKVGGPCRLFLAASSANAVTDLFRLCIDHGQKAMVIGNGSNIIFPDSMYEGVIICTANSKSMLNKNKIVIMGDVMTCDGGVLLSTASVAAYKASLGGLEFAQGIPGTVGGAVYMNAGAYAGEMSMIVEYTEYLDDAGLLHTLQKKDHDFAYRKSFFTEKGYCILNTTVRLKQAKKEDIKAVMDEYAEKRQSRQPLDKPSCGSVFKRPEGLFAGLLIQEAGLKGYKIGGAQVSEKHAGFIINAGGATSDDIKRLINHIQKTVYDNGGVMLETEIKIL